MLLSARVPSANQGVSEGEGTFCLLPGGEKGKNQARICGISVAAFPKDRHELILPKEKILTEILFIFIDLRRRKS